MTTAIITLGSNVSERRQILLSATEAIARRYCISRLSDIVESPDVTGGPTIYANRIIEISSDLPHDALSASLETIECSFGARHPGIVPLDIDIVIHDGQVIRPSDIIRPYYIAALHTLH